jgi:DNA polymerase
MNTLDELTRLVGDFRRSLAELERRGVVAVGAGPMPIARPEAPEAPEAPELPGELEAPPRTRRSLAAVRDELGDCQRCKLAKTRDKLVFGVGSETAELMFIGEAPGAEEDRRGEPFVGRAGQLLDKMIGAMGWTRETVFICNVLKCRPPNNRDPQPDEVEQCEPFLARQIEAIRPRMIVTLGKPAAHLVLKSRAPISALRGNFHRYQGIPVMPTFHPAYLLRSPERKSDTWSDLRKVIEELRRLGVETPLPPRD